MDKANTVQKQSFAQETGTESAGCNIITMPNLPNRVELSPTEARPKTTSQTRQRLARWVVLGPTGKAIGKDEGKRADVAARHPRCELVQITAHLNYAGRWWRLYKRTARPDDNWCIEFHRDGARTPRSLETSLLSTAEAEAKSFVDAWLQHRRDERSGLAPKATAAKCSTLGELFAVVYRLDMVAAQRGRDTYVWGARHFFQFALDLKSPADVDAMPLSVVSGQTGAQFFTSALAHVGTLATQQEQNKFKRQARGWFNNTKALFAADAVRSMPGCGLMIPDAASIAAFRASKPKRFKVPKTSGFIAPDSAVLRATFRQWIKLGRTPGYAVTGGGGNSRKKSELQPLNETARLAAGFTAGELAALVEIE